MRTLRPRLRVNALAGGLAAVGVVVLLVAGASGAASAHDSLETSSPAAGDSLTTDPGVVSLTFSDDLITLGEDTSGFAVHVVDSDGLHYESGCVTVQGTVIDTPVALGQAGGYVVTWRVVSSDGHPTSGQYEFDYEPTTLDGAHDGLTDSPVCGDSWAGDPDPDATSTPTPGAAAAPVATASTPVPASPGSEVTGADATGIATDAPSPASTPALPWPVVVLLALAGLGVIAAIVVLVLRRSRGGGYGGE